MEINEKKGEKRLQIGKKCIIIKAHPNNVKRIIIELASDAPSDQSDLFVFNNGQVGVMEGLYSNKEMKGVEKDKKMDITALYNQSAEWVIDQSGQADCVPVDLEKVLKTFNIATAPMDFSDIESRLTGDLRNAKILGALIPSGNVAAIFYSDKHKKDSHRTRFTIAHEIAHCCIQGNNAHIEFRIEGIEPNELEKAANAFAGALLIPENALNKIIDRLILPSLHTLSDIFEVSENVLRARLDYLGTKKNIVGYNI